MVGYLRRHHVALLALLIALGGTSYAAVGLAKNSVGAKQIKRSAVRSAEVKDRTLRKRDFKRGELPAGAPGPSGVVASRTIAGSADDFTLPGNMGGSIVTPVGCRTVPYTAGPDEFAVINLQLTGSPDTVTNNVLFLNVMASEDSAAFAKVSAVTQADTLNVPTTHVTTSHVQPLVAGTRYQWGSGLASNSGVDMDIAYCAGTVMIYRG